MGAFNVSGLSKLRLREDNVIKLLEENDLIGFSETWLTEKRALELRQEDMSLFVLGGKRSTGKGRLSGGISVYVNKNVAPYVRHVKNMHAKEMIWLLFERERTQLAIGFVYNPPRRSNYSQCGFFEALENDVSYWKGKAVDNIVLLGDFNARTGVLSDQVEVGDVSEHAHEPLPDYFDELSWVIPDRVNCDLIEDQNGRDMIDTLRSSSLVIGNGRITPDSSNRFTYMSTSGKSVIDYAVVSPPVLAMTTRVTVRYEVFASPHFPVEIELDMPTTLQAARRSDRPTEMIGKKVKRLQWKDEKERGYIASVQDLLRFITITCMMHLRTGAIDSAVSTLTGMIQHAARDMVNRPARSVIHKVSTWFTEACRTAKKQCQQALRRLRRTCDEESINSYLVRKSDYKQTLKDAKAEYMRKEKEGLVALYNQQDSRIMWNTVKKYVRPHDPMPPCITSGQWKTHFADVFSSTTENNLDWEVTLDRESEDLILDAEVTSGEVLQAIGRMKNNKSPGADGICSELIKAVKYVLAGLLAQLYSKLLVLGKYPRDWTLAVVVPIYKGKGSRNDPGSYRPVSLLSTLGKAFTSILNKRLVWWLQDRHIIHEAQAGFRKGYSTSDHALVIDTLIKEQLRKKRGKLYVCYVDLRKCFDSVNRQALIHKLHRAGIQGKFLSVIMAMYKVSSFGVRLTMDMITEPVEFFKGVYQGCLISPTLFLVFINDVIDALNAGATDFLYLPKIGEVPVGQLLYADDLALLSTAPVGLQRQLDRLSEYCDTWKLELNLEKSVIVVYRKGGRLARSEQWTYKGKKVDTVSKFKYLGFWTTPSGSWTCHTKTMVDQAKKALFLLNRVVYGVPNLPMRLLWHLFDTLISPILLYGSEIWGAFGLHEQLDRVETQFAKRIVRLPKSIASCGILLEMDRSWTAAWKAQLRAVTYWMKVVDMPDHRYPKIAYRHQRRILSRGVDDTWAGGIKKILVNAGMTDVWETEDHSLRSNFLRAVRDRIEQQAYSELLAEAQEMHSLDVYRSCKRQRGMDLALFESPTVIRRNLLLARLGSPTLIQFTKKENVTARVCKLCRCEIEKSQEWRHILWECPSMTVERAELEPISTGLIDDGQALFNSENYPTISNYIDGAIRKSNISSQPV